MYKTIDLEWMHERDGLCRHRRGHLYEKRSKVETLHSVCMFDFLVQIHDHKFHDKVGTWLNPDAANRLI